MNIIMISPLYQKREFENWVVSWTPGGRIKLVNRSSSNTVFVDYTHSKLKKILEMCEPKQETSPRKRICLHFNPQSVELLSSEYVGFLSDGSSVFVMNSETNQKGFWTLSGQGNYRQLHIEKRYCFLEPGNRYFLQSDGEITFFEEITIENLFTRYDEPVISVYNK